MELLISLIVIFILFVIFIRLTDNTHDKSNVIRYYYNFYVYYFILIVCSMFILPLTVFRPKNVVNATLYGNAVKFFAKILIKDISICMRNSQLLAKDQAAVIVANHQSSFDILALLNTWSIFDKLTVVAKKSLLYLWPFGLCAYMSGIIFIDRGNTINTYNTLDATTKLMVEKKIKVLLYPEGTRNRSGKGMMPFKKGAFNMAINAQVPIIPIVYSPYYFIKRDQYIFNRGKIIMECLEPVPTVGLTIKDVPELADRVRQKMMLAYERLSKEVTQDIFNKY